jgi:hypothetical protein
VSLGAALKRIPGHERAAHRVGRTSWSRPLLGMSAMTSRLKYLLEPWPSRPNSATPFRFVSKASVATSMNSPWASRLPPTRARARRRYIKLRRPQQNGKVEPSHWIDQEELWRPHPFEHFEAAAAALGGWEWRYNYKRLSLAIRAARQPKNSPALHRLRAQWPMTANRQRDGVIDETEHCAQRP